MQNGSLPLFPLPAKTEDYVLGWLQLVNEQSRFPFRPRTIQVYHAIWSAWCNWITKHPSKSPAEQVAQFLSKKPSAVTRKRYAELLARIYSWAKESGAAVEPWLAALPPPTRLESLPVINRTHPIAKKPTHWKKQRDVALIAWVQLTGQKAGELRTLQLQTLASRHELPQALLDWLDQHPTPAQAHALAFPADLTGLAALDPATIYRITRRQTKQKGGVAALRNGWICDQLEKTNLLEIQQALGHSRADSTKELVVKLKIVMQGEITPLLSQMNPFDSLRR